MFNFWCKNENNGVKTRILPVDLTVIIDIIKTDMSDLLLSAPELKVSNLTNWFIGSGKNQMGLKTGPAIDHSRMAVFGSFLQTSNSEKTLPKTAYVIYTESIDLLYYRNYCLRLG